MSTPSSPGGDPANPRARAPQQPAPAHGQQAGQPAAGQPPGQPAPGQPGVGSPGAPAQAGPQQPGGPAQNVPPAQAGATAPPPVSPDAERIRTVDATEQYWSNPQAEDQERVAREREERLSDAGAGGGTTVVVNTTVIGGTGSRERGRTREKAYPILATDIEQPFAATGSDAELAAALGARKLVVLRGRAGTGRGATLLRAFTGGDSSTVVLQLAEATDLRALRPSLMPPCGAMLLPDVTQDQLDQLTDFTVGQLTSELERSHRWLGLTLTDDLVIRPELRAMVVDLRDPPPPVTVFELRLGHPHGWSDRDLTAVRDHVRAHMAGHSSITLQQAAALGVTLASGHPPTPAELAKRVAGELDGADFAQWFRGLPDTRSRCTAIALAVFDGLPREVVTEVSDRLLETSVVRTRPRTVDPFRADASISVPALRARAEPAMRSAVEGDYPVTVLVYEDPNYPRYVLGHAWNELDSARPHVISWLRELGGHHDQEVRTAAAIAVGVLATSSFDFVYNQIIGDWAGAKDVRLRESAMLALGPPARDPRLRGTVDGIVQAWIASTDAPLKQATAARTFGGPSGRERFVRSMSKLAALAEIDDIDVALAVATSLGDFVLHGTPAMAGRVLTDVVGWVGQRRGELRSVGHFAFLRLTFLRGEPALMTGGDPSGRDRSLRTVPTMLILASQNPRIGECVVWLWTAGLTSGLASRRMRASLVRWAESVESHPAARAVLTEVVRRIHASDARAASLLHREPALSVLI